MLQLNKKWGSTCVCYIQRRLTRFGFHYLESVFREHGVSIVVMKDTDEEKTVQEELVEDMMALIASFSGKLYGIRSKGTKKTSNKKGDVSDEK